MYQHPYNRAQKTVKKNACMSFHDAARTLYLVTDTSRIGLGPGLLQVRDGMNYGHDEIPDNVILLPLHSQARPYQVQSGDTTT